ncbi:hypothetical protein BT96DRAFT_948707 [Gymnopus androsaceus JB14]|uniref:Uncharacterized protein n=1 Tax=Gymnopus androsaceus JB14 TaxID=1447944 RepID=A0A6A4GNU7_9AGAR|nr:hypothetical protein BT96DRAFT_948707 [Gymnopus androsaceus JB14]
MKTLRSDFGNRQNRSLSTQKIDCLDEVITCWLAFETEKLLQQYPTPALPSTSTDSRDSPAPISTSNVPPPSIPQVVVNFMVDKIASDLPPSTSPAAHAWNLLHKYMTNKKPPSSDEVKMSLDKLQVGEEWHAMRIRIMQVKPDNTEAAWTLLADLEKMKPVVQVDAEQEQEVDAEVNSSLKPFLIDNEYNLSSKEQEEHDGLTALVAHAAMLEECEVFYVRCQILVGFPPRLAPTEQPHKKPKVLHLQSEEVLSQHALTIVLALPVNGKHRAAQPRRAKVYQGSESILSFTVYTMSGQTVTDSSIALVVLNHVNVQEATTILAKDLTPGSLIMVKEYNWLFTIGLLLEMQRLTNLSLMPKVHLTHEPSLPCNAMLTMNQSGTSNSLINTSTGCMRWANMEIKVIGIENDNNIAQMHNSALGQVIDVFKNSSMKSGIGYTPTHSLGEIYHDYGWSKGIMQLEHEQVSAAWKRLDDEERQEAAAHEQQAIVIHDNQLQDTTFTQGGAPLTLRAATLTPLTNWIDDPEITKGLPRGKVMVALRDISDDVEIVISAEEDGSNKAVYWVKPKGKAPIGTIITAQHLNPFICGHTADKSYSPKLFLICSGKHAGQLGHAIIWGIDDNIILKPVQHEAQMMGKKYKVTRFVEKPVNGPLLHVLELICAHVPMMPDEEKAAKTASPIRQLQHIVKKQLLGMTLTDEEKVLVGE